VEASAQVNRRRIVPVFEEMVQLNWLVAYNAQRIEDSNSLQVFLNNLSASVRSSLCLSCSRPFTRPLLHLCLFISFHFESSLFRSLLLATRKGISVLQ